MLSSFASHAMGRDIARDPSRFGRGTIEGVASPEAANNAATIGHFIFMLTLGILAGTAIPSSWFSPLSSNRCRSRISAGR